MYIGYLVPYQGYQGAVFLADNGLTNAKAELMRYCSDFFEKNGHKPYAYVYSYGCQQNVSDGEKLKGQLSLIGYDFTDDTEQSLKKTTKW